MAAPLPQDAWRYNLFQALRLLEARLPGGARLGEQGPASAERIRLRPSTSLGFQSNEVVDIDIIEHAGRESVARVTTNLPGLYGVGSPLPRSYPHRILLEDEELPQQRDFLDLIHHRLFSIWYRAWRQYHYEQCFQADGKDLLSRALLDWLGVSDKDSIDTIGIEPLRLLRYLGLFAQKTRPVQGLVFLFEEELALPVHIEQLPARFVTLRPDKWCRLSADPRKGGALGRDLILGAQRLDRMGGLRVHVGPVAYRTLLALWPGGELLHRVVALCRYYLRQPLDLQLRVSVPRSEVPQARFGGDSPPRLGGPSAVGAIQQDPIVFEIKTSLAEQNAGSRGAVASHYQGEDHVPR